MLVFSVRILCATVILSVCLTAANAALVVPLEPIQSAWAPSNDPVTTVPFPTAGNVYFSATNGAGILLSGGETAPQWTAGDFVRSSVFDLPTSLVTDITANWTVDNELSNGAGETWIAAINGVAVAQAVLSDCGGCIQAVTGTVPFAGLAPVGGGYQVELVLQNTLAAGDGSASWRDGGLTGLSYTGVPEASTWAMMMIGLAGLGLAGARKMRRRRSVLSAG